MRSYVVKRLLHFRHSRRRRMDSASLLSRESTTLSFANPQKGHFMGWVTRPDQPDSWSFPHLTPSTAKSAASKEWTGRTDQKIVTVGSRREGQHRGSASAQESTCNDWESENKTGLAPPAVRAPVSPHSLLVTEGVKILIPKSARNSPFGGSRKAVGASINKMPQPGIEIVRLVSVICKSLGKGMRRSGSRGDKRRRRIRNWHRYMEVLAIGGDPVGRDVMLSGYQIHIPLAHHEMQAILQLILDVGVPHRVLIGLGPQIPDIGGLPQFWGDQIVDLRGVGPRGEDSVFFKDFSLQGN